MIDLIFNRLSYLGSHSQNSKILAGLTFSGDINPKMKMIHLIIHYSVNSASSALITLQLPDEL